MKAYLIDPWTRTVTLTTHNGDFREIYKHLDGRLGEIGRAWPHYVDCFDIVRLDHGDGIYVDDEGLLKDGPQAFFTVGGYGPLAGRGLVLGSDYEGNSTDAKTTLRKLRELVSWDGIKTNRAVTDDELAEILEVSLTGTLAPLKENTQ